MTDQKRVLLAMWAIGLTLWLLVVGAVVAFAQTPEPEDPAIVALASDLQASTNANGHMVQSLRALVQAYQVEKAKLAAAQRDYEARLTTAMEWLKAAQAPKP